MTADLAADLAGAQPIPKGWEPYAEEAGQIGSAIVRLPRPTATEYDLLIGAGFDPDLWQISGPINSRRWMRHDQEWLYYFKFDVVAGESPRARAEHVDDLVKHIRKRRKALTANYGDMPTGDAWAYFASDWQIGKAEGAVGTDQTIDRVLESFDLARLRVQELRRNGRRIPHGALVGLGDIVEGCHGNYPNQPFLVDRNRRDQNKLARELITYGIDTLAPLFERFTVASVAGNHGEHRNDGKKVTDDADNDDVACFEGVREAFDRAGVELDWLIPHDELSIALSLGGVAVGGTHGHTFGRGSTPQQKALEWFKGQVFGMQEVQHCEILVSAHFHHFLATQAGRRTLFQTPAMDPGSSWFRNRTGEDTGPGVLTMRFDKSLPYRFADLQLLTPSA